MENLLLLMAGTYLLRRSRRPVRTPIGRQGCTFLAAPSFHPKSGQTVWGDRLYEGAYYRGRQWHGIIHVELAQSLCPEEAHCLMHRYLEGLQRSFGITENTGAEPAEGPAGSSSCTDYWQDSTGTDWKVQGYTDGRHITVLYVRHLGAGSCDTEEAFLQSLSYDPLY